MRLGAIVVDLAVLGPQAWTYLERVCAELPGLGVVVCTGQSTVAQRVRGLRLGADDWVTKPCHPEELIARVEAVVRRRRRAEARADPAPGQAGEVEIRADQFQAFVGRPVDRPHPPRVRADPAARRRRGPGARARGDLPARLGLRDGPRRPLGGRLRAQAAPEARAASPEWRYIHTHFGVGYRFAPEAVDGSPDEEAHRRPRCRPGRSRSSAQQQARGDRGGRVGARRRSRRARDQHRRATSSSPWRSPRDRRAAGRRRRPPGFSVGS